MAIESTLLIVKPDGVRRGLVGEVLRRVEAKGLAIEELRLFTIARVTAEEHYGEHREKPFFGELVDFITGGPVVVAKVTGEDAIIVLARADGSDEPRGRAPGVDPRGLRHADRREHRARLGLRRVGRARAEALLRVGTMPGLQEAFDRIGEAVERQLPLTHAPGMAVAVTDGEEILGAVVRGLADVDRGTPIAPHTRFQIASMSKSFAGAAGDAGGGARAGSTWTPRSTTSCRGSSFPSRSGP